MKSQCITGTFKHTYPWEHNYRVAGHVSNNEYFFQVNRPTKREIAAFEIVMFKYGVPIDAGIFDAYIDTVESAVAVMQQRAA